MDPKASTPPIQKTNKLGFKFALLALLALLLVGGITFAGMSLRSQNNNLKTQKADSDKKIQELEQQVEELMGEDTSSESTNEGFLEVPQWGVKFKEAGDKLSYKIIVRSDGEEALLLTNSTGKNIKPEYCSNLGDALYLVSIEKNVAYPGEAGLRNLLAEFGGNKYYLSASNGLCSDDEKEGQVRDDLIRDAKTIQAI